MESNPLKIDIQRLIEFSNSLLNLEIENRLIKYVVKYAKKGEFTRYTSTLEEAWRISIHQLSISFSKLVESNKNTIPELHVDLDYVNDPAAAFGIYEAKMHRSRGITLGLFLALMKYYQQSYIDILNESAFENEEKQFLQLYLNRFFDRIEIGFSMEWAESSKDKVVGELQERNRFMTNEKNKYLTIFESLNNPVLLVNKDGDIENINHKGSEFFEIGHSPGAHYYNKTEIKSKLSWLRNEIDNFLLKDENELIIEKKVATSKGIQYFEINFHKMLDISDKFSGLTIIFNNVTEFIEFDNLRKNFVSTVSHELRTPITSIDLSINLLKKNFHVLNEEKKQHLIEIISNSSNSLTQLINDLLILSRIDAKKEMLDLQEVELNKVINAIITELEPQTMAKSIKIIHKNQENILLMADEFRIAQIIRIILDNAIKYSHQNSEVEINITKNYQACIDKRETRYIIITFKDTGIGIKKSDLKNIFDRFFRSQDVINIKGTGLGLSIAKELVDLHHGTIEVESEFGKGTTVSVTFPC